ncbi:MAG: hypothetical protein WC969_15270 [Elusimicrobiota bacterium]|jgi:hypothetical protein
MSEETPLEPVETLEAALDSAGDELVRAYVTRLGGASPRISVGRSLELRRDRPVLDQLVEHVLAFSTEGGGLFEVKLKAKGAHIGSARVNIEFPADSREAPGETPRRSSAFPRDSRGLPGGSPPDDEVSSRAVNRGAQTVSPEEEELDRLIRVETKRNAYKKMLLGPEDDDDEEEEDEEPGTDEKGSAKGDDDEEEKDPDKKAVESLVKSTAEFLVSESGKTLLARLGNAIVDRIELGADVLRKQTELIALQSAKLGGTQPPPPATQPTTTTEQPKEEESTGPRVLRIHLPSTPQGGGQAA